MDAFEVATLLAEQARSGKAYLEFLRVPSMSLGVYRPPVGSIRRVRIPKTRCTMWSAVER
jgi:hypothetical protein